VSDTLRVSFQVRVPRAANSLFGPVETDLLNFTGETELSLPDLKKILSAIISGATVEQYYSNPSVDEAKTAPAVNTTGVQEIVLDSHKSSVTAKRKSPRRKTKLVCLRCGRSFKGMGITQKYCHKADCTEVSLRKIAQQSTARVLKNYPTKRMSPTPRTSAICQRCGRSYLAYTKLQKRCGRDDCYAYAAASTTLEQHWRPQATLVAGQGVVSGSCLT
jgi:ribosomal protein L37E